MAKVNLGNVTLIGEATVMGVAVFTGSQLTVMSDGLSISFEVDEVSEAERDELSGKKVQIDSNGIVTVAKKDDKPAKQAGCGPSRQVL